MPAQSGGNFTLKQSVIASGGGQSSTGGAFSLDGTIGQSLAGDALTGSQFAVTSGFWNYTPSAPNSLSYEADVKPRPNGSLNGLVSISDVQQVLRFSSGSDSDYQSNEFQRADCAPYNPAGNSGDARVSISDVQQALRYSSGSTPPQLAGGPTAPKTGGGQPELSETTAAPLSAITLSGFGKPLKNNSPGAAARTLRVSGGSGYAGQVVTVEFFVDNADGTEKGFGFSLDYDRTLLTYNSGSETLRLPRADASDIYRRRIKQHCFRRQ